MPIAYQIAVDALQNETARVEMISNNLVNAASTGFKRGLLTSSAFADNVAALTARGAVKSPALRQASAMATDFSQGAMSETRDLNHVAMAGPGFFEIRSGDQVLYTRAGAFRKDDRGRLVNGQGFALQGEGGDVVLKSDVFRIERDGTVTQAERVVTRLRLVDFPNRAALQRAGAGNFDAGTQASTAVKSPSVRQGFLEASNVSSSTEMVQLMEAVKRFEFGQRVVQTQDDMMDRAIRRIGESQ